MANLVKFFTQFTESELSNIQAQGKKLFIENHKGWTIPELDEEIDLNYATQVPASWKKRENVAKTVVLFNFVRTVGMTDKESDELLQTFKGFANR